MMEYATDLNEKLDSLLATSDIKEEVKTVKDILNKGKKYRECIGKIEFGIRM